MKKKQNKPPEFLTENFVYNLMTYKIEELKLQGSLQKIIGKDGRFAWKEANSYGHLRACYGSLGYNGLTKKEWERIGIAFAEFCHNPATLSDEKLDKMNNDLITFINSLS